MKNALPVLSRPLFAALLALAALSPVPRAQESAPASATETLPAAREILDRYIEATNLEDVLEKTKSTHVKGKVSIPAVGIEGPMESWQAKPDRHVVVINLGAYGDVRSGHDGKVAWNIHPMLGSKILKDSELLNTKLEASYDAGLKTPELYESLETVGRESFDGKDCYKVEVVVKPLPGMDAEKTKETRTSYEFYDVGSGLLVGKKGVLASDMGDTPYSAHVSDYKTFGEQLIATKSVQKHSGQEIVITVESVEFDTVSDDVFVLPKEIQTLANAEAKPAPAGQ